MFILQYDKTQFTLTEEEAKRINEFLSRRDRPTHFTFKGKSLMARKMEVLEEGHENKPAYLEFQWTDEHLEKWENEIFPQFSTFEEYLISQGAWVINDKYPNGAVRDFKKYRELNTKWVALQTLRYKRNPTKTLEALDKIRAKLAGNMSVCGDNLSPEPISKTEKPISKEQKSDNNLGLTEGQKTVLREIPF